MSRHQLAAAIYALRSNTRDLADEITGEANIDRCFIVFLKRLNDQLPEKPPTYQALFQTGHASETLKAYKSTVDEEWPAFLGSRFHALVQQFDRTLCQSGLWREFLRNAADQMLTPEQMALASPLAVQVANALRSEEATTFVDPAVPDLLEQLALDFHVPGR